MSRAREAAIVRAALGATAAVRTTSDEGNLITEVYFNLQAFLTALEAEGLAVVPVKPTEEMVTAGDRAITWADNTEPSIAHGRRHLANVYRAMLAAAIREGKD